MTCVPYDMRRVTDQYLKTKMGERTPSGRRSIEQCHQYPNAKAMLMLMGVITPPKAVRQTVKSLHSKVGCFVDERSNVKIVGDSGSFEHDELSGQVRGGSQNTMLFITDLDYTTKATTSMKITTIALGLQNEMALQCCRTFQIKGDSHRDIINVLESVLVFLETSKDQGISFSGTTVHIWLCMKCMYPCGGTVKLTESSFKGFTQDFIEVVDKIAMLLNRSFMLSMLLTSKFFGAGRVDCRQFIVDLILRARCHCHEQVKGMENYAVDGRASRVNLPRRIIKELHLGNR